MAFCEGDGAAASRRAADVAAVRADHDPFANITPRAPFSAIPCAARSTAFVGKAKAGMAIGATGAALAIGGSARFAAIAATRETRWAAHGAGAGADAFGKAEAACAFVVHCARVAVFGTDARAASAVAVWGRATVGREALGHLAARVGALLSGRATFGDAGRTRLGVEETQAGAVVVAERDAPPHFDRVHEDVVVNASARWRAALCVGVVAGCGARVEQAEDVTWLVKHDRLDVAGVAGGLGRPVEELGVEVDVRFENDPLAVRGTEATVAEIGCRGGVGRARPIAIERVMNSMVERPSPADARTLLRPEMRTSAALHETPDEAIAESATGRRATRRSKRPRGRPR